MQQLLLTFNLISVNGFGMENEIEITVTRDFVIKYMMETLSYDAPPKLESKGEPTYEVKTVAQAFSELIKQEKALVKIVCTTPFFHISR